MSNEECSGRTWHAFNHVNGSCLRAMTRRIVAVEWLWWKPSVNLSTWHAFNHPKKQLPPTPAHTLLGASCGSPPPHIYTPHLQSSASYHSYYSWPLQLQRRRSRGGRNSPTFSSLISFSDSLLSNSVQFNWMAGSGLFGEILDGDVFKYYSDGEWKKSSSGKSVSIINPTTRKPQYKVQGTPPNKTPTNHGKLRAFFASFFLFWGTFV